MVKVCGNVFYDDYKGGDILVYWRKKLRLEFPRPENKPCVIKSVPGKYCIYVPKIAGSFYVSAKCTLINSAIKKGSDAYFVSDLIVVDPQKDKIKIDVHLKKRKKLMDYYKGQVVQVSGRIIQENYIGDLLAVAVETPENHRKVYLPPDINHKFISHPGNYSIYVPVNIGKIYINVLSYPDTDPYKVVGDMPGVIFSNYKNNPIDVGFADIDGVDLIISKRNGA